MFELKAEQEKIDRQLSNQKNADAPQHMSLLGVKVPHINKDGTMITADKNLSKKVGAAEIINPFAAE